MVCNQAWMKEDEEEALDNVQEALTNKRKNNKNGSYIKFISHFGPALTGTAFWNNNKNNKLVSEILTITDEAFIHLCIINYSATWKAQEKIKAGETDVQVPVSPCVMVCDFCTDKQLTNTSIVIVSILGLPRLQANCHVDGLKMASKLSTNWPKKYTTTAMSMERNLTRPSRKASRKKWPATTKLAKGKETVSSPTMI